MGQVRIGISGWVYPRWRGVFYPKGLQQRRELEYASRQMNSIEINGSFYSLQRPESYRAWYDQTPESFLFSVKGGRFITHMKKLKDVELPVARFFGSGVLLLKEKLGPVLWQLPPQLGYHRDKMESFLKLLPKTVLEATEMIHATQTAAHPLTETYFLGLENQEIRHAFEIRHESFLTLEFFELLKQYRMAWVVADSAGKFPYREILSTDFAYVRLHGSQQLYASGYTNEELDAWAEKIHAWEPRGDVYVYFDNDAKVHAPFDAIQLARRLGPEATQAA